MTRPAASPKEGKKSAFQARTGEKIDRSVLERMRALEEANLALRQSEQKLRTELRAAVQLRDLATRLISGGGVAELCPDMLETAAAIMAADFASIQRLETHEGAGGRVNALRLLGWKNFQPESAKFWELVRTDSECSCGVALRDAERIIIRDVERCESLAGTADLQAYLRSGIRSVQSTPLTSRSGRILGMISTHWRRPHEPGEDELRVFNLLARQVADVIEREHTELRSTGGCLLNITKCVESREPKSGTVLYVEDDESDVLFMKWAFAGKGLDASLQIVRDGRAAVEYLSGIGAYADRMKFPLPSVVLLDVNLPRVSGFGVLQWMRDDPRFAQLPAVMFSSSTLDGDRTKATELGANDFLVKPNSGLKFKQILEQLQEKWLDAPEPSV